jgi:diacylglycerol kinase family enzyme
MFATLLTGEPRLIDSGLINGHPFFTSAGLGLEAIIAERFARLQRRGFLRYLTHTAAALRNHQPETCRLHHGDQVTEAIVFTLAVSNCDQYGNNAYIAPGAKVDDGLLDLTCIPPIGLGNALPLAVQLFTRRLDRNPRVIRLRAASLEIERTAPGLIHTDGEPHQADARLVVTVRPQSLRVITPKAAAH